MSETLFDSTSTTYTVEPLTFASVKAAMEKARRVLAGIEENEFAPITRADELGLKLQGKILLRDPLRRLHVPSRGEFIGVNLLERDDELPPRRNPKG